MSCKNILVVPVMRNLKIIYVSIFIAVLHLQCHLLATAFTPNTSTMKRDFGISKRSATTTTTLPFHSTKLYFSNNNNNIQQQYDISKPVFDLYSFRQVRGDALTKYNSLNQSEPLRINLFLLSTLSLLSSPFLSQELGNNNNEGTSIIQTFVIPWVGAAITMFLFIRECQARNRQLVRLEKELNALSLPIKLPTNAFSDSPYQKSTSVMKAIKDNGCRIIVVAGNMNNDSQLQDNLLQFRILSKRLQQANTYVVVVPLDESGLKSLSMYTSERYPWLAIPEDLTIWKKYIQSLSEDFDSSNDSSASFAWFGLTPSGRSFGSGKVAPSWIQVMGKSLSPLSVLDESDENEQSEILKYQQQFYDALTNGKLDVMNNEIFDIDAPDNMVSDVMNQGGRLDSWEYCLKDDARPSGMIISGCDSYIVDETTAYTTCIEFPAVGMGADGASLLAIQTWVKNNNDWKLQLHQTIPWTPGTPAAGTLLCDCRGCVSLVRTPERRTFGGVFG